MTEEENKAIEYLEKYIKNDKEDIKILNNTIDEDIDYYTEVEPIQKRVKYLETIKNLIEKLQKENLLLSAKENMSAYFEFKRNYIPKDKIRELFKQLYIIEESKYAKMKTIDSDKAFKFVKDIEELLEEGQE